MKIAICDDNKQELLSIVSLVEEYRNVRKVQLSYVSFQSATELLYSMKREYDTILLDVMMPGFSGMQAAHEIRGYNDKVHIVFLTSSPEYAVESYSVKAREYLLKPASEEKLFPILDRLVDDLRKPEDAICVKMRDCVFSLPYGKIEYMEVNAKKLYFYLADGSVREGHGSFAEFEQALLARRGFMKVHRSYLVNFQWMQELQKGRFVTASGRHVPVSRAGYAQVRTAYSQFLFAEVEGFDRDKEGFL